MAEWMDAETVASCSLHCRAFLNVDIIYSTGPFAAIAGTDTHHTRDHASRARRCRGL